MKTQTAQASFAEALSLLTGLGDLIPQSCFHARLQGADGVWGVTLIGHRGPQMSRLLRLMGVREVERYEPDGSHHLHRRYVGHRGRTAIEITTLERIVRRVNGVSGEDETVGGLW